MDVAICGLVLILGIRHRQGEAAHVFNVLVHYYFAALEEFWWTQVSLIIC